MTTSGEPTPAHRPRRSRTVALLGALAVSAAVATWAEVHYAGGGTSTVSAAGDLSQDSVAAPEGAGQSEAAPSSLLEMAQTVLPATADVPVTSTNPTALQATRYAIATGLSCTDALASAVPRSATAACQNYLTASYVSTDRSLVASVTVLVYPDAATAKRAKPQLSPAGSAVFHEPGDALPGVTAAEASAQSRIEQVGRFVTVVQAAYASGAVQPTADLATPVWYLSAQLADDEIWNS
ncbi:hypothetical protein [Streptacidiphilus rugosus]|uniref:hypothetical protein n=1 Tax=Streptacidiphilus rugosus TaxID=405783 RepID=UPI000560E012|nr:hypothetical protein [Streptacidiphilus rugosus]